MENIFLLYAHVRFCAAPPAPPAYDAYVFFLPTSPLHHHLTHNAFKSLSKKVIISKNRRNRRNIVSCFKSFRINIQKDLTKFLNGLLDLPFYWVPITSIFHFADIGFLSWM